MFKYLITFIINERGEIIDFLITQGKSSKQRTG
jgi:hypothetical protein